VAHGPGGHKGDIRQGMGLARRHVVNDEGRRGEFEALQGAGLPEFGELCFIDDDAAPSLVLQGALKACRRRGAGGA